MSKGMFSILVGAALGAAAGHFWGHYEWQTMKTLYCALVGAFIAAITAR